jgi:hypothetical protein
MHFDFISLLAQRSPLARHGRHLRGHPGLGLQRRRVHHHRVGHGDTAQHQELARAEGAPVRPGLSPGDDRVEDGARIRILVVSEEITMVGGGDEMDTS